MFLVNSWQIAMEVLNFVSIVISYSLDFDKENLVHISYLNITRSLAFLKL